tara:strand:+ start:76 stop:576 length:501 start_codon:yes stop_codon:yes gene_type:complete
MYRLILLIILIFIGCNKEVSEHDLLHKSDPLGSYGGTISLIDVKRIGYLIDNSEKYLNSNVLISGKILEVCPMRGCWINVKDMDSDIDIRVKVTDGEIVFPLSSKGLQVDVQGIFSKLEFSKEQAIKWKVHLAEEKGIKLAPEDVEINPSDLYEYRIIGKAAKIFN